MTAPLGSTVCPALGCRRDRHVSPSGIRYGFCIAHCRDLLGRAFSANHDVQQGAGTVVSSRHATASGSLLIGVLPTSAVVSG